MKRNGIGVCCLVLCLVACKPGQKMEGNYFSREQDCLSIEEKGSSIENFKNGFVDHLFARETKRKITFSTTEKNRLFARNVQRYRFKFLDKNDDSIVVMPFGKNSKAFFNQREQITFRNKYAFADKEIRLKKIVYHTNGCGWFCPFISLEIDSTGNIRYTFRGDGRMDTTKSKSYSGKLLPNELDRLGQIAKYAQLRTIRWPEDWPIADYTNITLIIYFNDQRLHVQGMGIPMAIAELVRYIGGISKHPSLVPVNEQYQYER